jgi:hypothetical protein
VLDSNIASNKEQLQWFKSVVESERHESAIFTVVVVHIAPFVEYWEPNAWEKGGEKHWGEDIRFMYVPLFDMYSVDLVLSGHSHIYQRGNNAPKLGATEGGGKRPEFSKRQGKDRKKHSTTYVIGGGGGAELETEGINHVEDYDFYHVTKFEFHYLRIDVVGCKERQDKDAVHSDCRMEIQATNPLTEKMIDQFTLHSQPRAVGAAGR